MPVREKLSLDSSLVVARKRYDECPCSVERTIQLTFDQLLKLFSQDCNSFSDIGELTGVTRERIRQVYKAYFAHLFPHRANGRKRVKLCILKRRLLLSKEAPEDNDFLKKIMELAIVNGLNAQRIHDAHPTVNSFYERKLLVNNKSCCLKRITIFDPFPDTKYSRQYFKFYLSASVLRANRFIVIMVDISSYDQSVYIFPTSYFIRLFPEETKHKNFYISTTNVPVYNNNSPLISFRDFQSYRDAWHLLKN